MADDTFASVIPLHHVPLKKRERKATARSGTKRQRKRKTKAAAEEMEYPSSASVLPSEFLIPPEFLPANDVDPEPPVTPPPAVTSHRNRETVAPARRHLASVLLSIAALALAAVGITINGWFARSLGSSDIAGWLFLAVGVAADLVALVMPSCAAGLWQSRHRATALVGWAVWLMTFVFAVTAGIGFASTNISDVTIARASRVTPAIAGAQAALNDAMAARDRECKSGVGKFCREREAAVVERRQLLDSAVASVGQSADAQSDAAIKLVTWLSHGLLRPTMEDFAMLRLVLLALLPQIGGILLLVGRHSALKSHH
ncbi:hypothetical protein [Bradyrhizobium erythrophlei]|jgi:hypothetical protein|uniref:Uncharacterized protein n=1 Tax=Bradyrhizobium erythrophlei TaxID=1437360 RepID=A0A1M7TIW6_9BRAD|nr:hypothetical protein [Bradyrhizobium erythrophlei]SHN70684.1 hypothetical protein SAMN05444170_1813 [Bradyrhizobium erythrophlei]